MTDYRAQPEDEPNPVEAQWQTPSAYELPYGNPLRRDEAEEIESLRRQFEGAVEALRVARACIVDYNPADDGGFHDDAVGIVLDQIDAALRGQ